jgi:HlyD family secretion protein
VALLEKRVADSRVVAPSAGRVAAKYIEPGELVSPGAPLLRLSDHGRVWIMIYVPETELPRIRLGQAAAIRVDAFPGRELPGSVTFISTQAEFTPKNVQTREERSQLVFAVKVEADNPGEVLKPGLPADVLLGRQGAQATPPR